MTATIFNIQHFSLHDGNGIRTTVFFKGCPLKCVWCHNPESIPFSQSVMYDHKKCTNCQSCVEVCQQSALRLVEGKILRDENKCTLCSKCVDSCFNQVRKIAGRDYSVEEVFDDIISDRVFYAESNGGVTLSGGEPLMQIDFAVELSKRLHESGLSVNIDTSGAVPFSYLDRIYPYIDTFLYDIKLTDQEIFRQYVGGDLNLILDNLRKLSKIHHSISLRLPIIVGVNSTREHISRVVDIAKECHIEHIYLLPYHNISENKYLRLGEVYNSETMSAPSSELLYEFATMIESSGLKCYIGG